MNKSSRRTDSEIKVKQHSPIHFSVPESKPSLHEVLTPKTKVQSIHPGEVNDVDRFVLPFSAKKEWKKESQTDGKLKTDFNGSAVDPCFDYEMQLKNLETDIPDLCKLNVHTERPPEEFGNIVSRFGRDDLAQINQYCWHGTRDLTAPIDILVLGDSPHDAVFTLADQLADHPHARVTYFDPDEKNLEHTKSRLQLRAEQQNNPNLVNMVDFQTVLPDPGACRFDYIRFRALFFENETFAQVRSLLKENGVLGLGVRGQVAQAPQETVRHLMEIVNRGIDDEQTRIQNTQLMLKHLPKSNPMVQNGLSADYMRDRVRLYFDFIKPGYRSFTLSHLVQWLNDHRLTLARFQSQMQAFLNPDMYPCSLPRSLTRHLNSLPRLNQIAFAELFWGNIDRFEIYAFPDSSQNGPLDLMDPDIIPCFSDHAKKQGFDSMAGNPAQWLTKRPSFPFSIFGKTVSVGIHYDPLVADFLSRIDGRTTVRSITAQWVEKQSVDQEKIILHCMKAVLHFIEAGVILFCKKIADQ